MEICEAPILIPAADLKKWRGKIGGSLMLLCSSSSIQTLEPRQIQIETETGEKENVVFWCSNPSPREYCPRKKGIKG